MSRRRPFKRRDREAVVARLDRLLWIMESVGTGGWSRALTGRRSPNPSEGDTGDSIVLAWLDRLTAKIDDDVEFHLAKLDAREEKLMGTTSEIQSALRRRRADDRCPSCGASTRSAGSF